MNLLPVLDRIHRKLNIMIIMIGVAFVGFGAMLVACWHIFLRLPR
jgi:hypothetical protein